MKACSFSSNTSKIWTEEFRVITPAEVLSEIQKLPLSDARQVTNRLNGYLRQQEQVALSDDELERREDEFEQYLLVKGLISSIPTRDETD